MDKAHQHYEIIPKHFQKGFENKNLEILSKGILITKVNPWKVICMGSPWLTDQKTKVPDIWFGKSRISGHRPCKIESRGQIPPKMALPEWHLVRPILPIRIRQDAPKFHPSYDFREPDYI